MQAYLTSLGCRLNEAELQQWANQFHQHGFALAKDAQHADVSIINTCAVTAEAARKSRQTIRRLHRQNPQAKLVVTGCYASLQKAQAESLLGVDLIVDNADKPRLPQLVQELVEFPVMPYFASEPAESALFHRNRERAFIKIQDGCRYRCTYCVVTIARGEEKSRSIQELLTEIHQLEKQNIQEIVLTGVHVGGYGVDIGESLFSLVENILQHSNIARIRFASVEPWDLPENFFQLFKNKRLMPHMHLPIQSGSEKILKKMSRRCYPQEFLTLISKAREVVEDFNITSDIIVGFPGETAEDFALSQQIIELAEFAHTHIFSYSKREGTKAANLPNQIDKQTKKTRSQILHQVAAKQKKLVMRKMIGKQANILWESNAEKLSDGSFRYYGYTENYHKIYLQTDSYNNLNGEITRCEIVGYDETNACLVAESKQLSSKPSTRILIKKI